MSIEYLCPIRDTEDSCRSPAIADPKTPARTAPHHGRENQTDAAMRQSPNRSAPLQSRLRDRTGSQPRRLRGLGFASPMGPFSGGFRFRVTAAPEFTDGLRSRPQAAGSEREQGEQEIPRVVRCSTWDGRFFGAEKPNGVGQRAFRHSFPLRRRMRLWTPDADASPTVAFRTGLATAAPDSGCNRCRRPAMCRRGAFADCIASDPDVGFLHSSAWNVNTPPVSSRGGNCPARGL
jgi:hypothetical protein